MRSPEYELAVITSSFLSPLRSATRTAIGSAPTAVVLAISNMPPPLPRATATALSPRLAVIRSSFLSPLRSARTSDTGPVPTSVLLAPPKSTREA